MIQESGVTLDRKRVEYLPEDAVLKPLGDRIAVRPLPWKPSATIDVVSSLKPLRGVVVAVGPGYRQKRRYLDSKGQCYKIGETGRIRPMDVKVGDVVELGGLELGGYSFPKVNIGTTEYLICQEQDVAGVVEG